MYGEVSTLGVCATGVRGEGRICSLVELFGASREEAALCCLRRALAAVSLACGIPGTYFACVCRDVLCRFYLKLGMGVGVGRMFVIGCSCIVWHAAVLWCWLGLAWLGLVVGLGWIALPRCFML